MNELNLSQFISGLENNLGYSMQSNSFTLTSAVASENNTMQVDQVYTNNNNIENAITIIEPNLQPTAAALSPPSSSPSSSSSNPIVQSKSIKKRQRYSVEYKKKILHMLETNSQQKVQDLVNIDRRVIGKWTKEVNKTKIENCLGARSTYKIFGAGKGWWPELEARLYQWFKEVRARGGCVSEKCFNLLTTNLFGRFLYVISALLFLRIKKY